MRADPRRRCSRATRAPADRRRPARRLPLGRDRLLRGRRGDGGSSPPSRCETFSIGFDHEALRRAAARARRSRSGSAPSTRSSWSAPSAVEIAAAARPPLRRAVRRLLGDPELLPGRADPPPRHRRPQRRRRRRDLRAATRATSPTPSPGAWTAFRRRCAADSPALGAPAARRRRASRASRNRARRLAGTLGARRAGALRRATCRGSTPRSATRSTRPDSLTRSADAGADDAIAARWAAASGAVGRRPDARGRRRTYLADDLIAKIDIATMAHALEARSPFLDHELMELAASIPADSRCAAARRSGSCARRCAAGCRTTILDRPKQGFSVPLVELAARRTCGAGRARSCSTRHARTRLLRAAPPSRGLLDRHAAGADGDAKRIWALLMLELWHREFIDARGRASSGCGLMRGSGDRLDRF